MEKNINTHRFLNDTVTHLNRTLDRSEAMAAKLMINTGDVDGAKLCLVFIQELRNSIAATETGLENQYD